MGSFFGRKMQKARFVWYFCGRCVGVIPFLMKNALERIFESIMQIFQSRDKRKMPNFDGGKLKSRFEIGQAIKPSLRNLTTKGWISTTKQHGKTLMNNPCNRCANIVIF